MLFYILGYFCNQLPYLTATTAPSQVLLYDEINSINLQQFSKYCKNKAHYHLNKLQFRFIF